MLSDAEMKAISEGLGILDKKIAERENMYKGVTFLDVETPENPKINHPSHYAGGRKYEPIAVIEDWNLNFNLGNVVKYISRAGRKGDTLEDLEKALWYLTREVEKRKHIHKGLGKRTDLPPSVGERWKDGKPAHPENIRKWKGR